MYFVFGSRLYGKVDKVPGHFWVATKFAHVYYIPLIPTETWLVTSQTDKHWRGKKIPLSLKSILTAWFRVAAIGAAVVGAVLAIIAFNDSKTQEAIVHAIVAAIAIALVVFTYKSKWLNTASVARAHRLMQLAGLEASAEQLLARAYPQQVSGQPFTPLTARAAAAGSVRPAQVIPSPSTPPPIPQQARTAR